MPCPCPAVPSPVVALPGWCPLSPAGAQSPQLLVEPPWTLAVLWDRVTLTCQGSGTAGDTTWYKDGQRWGQEGRDSFRVTESGTYTCERPGTRRSSPVRMLNGEKGLGVPSLAPTVTLRAQGGLSSMGHPLWRVPVITGVTGSPCPLDSVVLQVPARALLEGDRVTLRCRSCWNLSVTSVSFYREGKKLATLHNGTELSLSPLQLHHSGRYRCKGRVGIWGWRNSAPVPVTVQELFSVPVLEGSPEFTEGSPLNLSCLSTPSPLRPPAPLLYRFYRHGQLVGGPQGSPQLLVPAVGVSHSGNYSWVPLSRVSLSVQPPGAQVALGDRLVLSCAVAMGTGPLSFSWHRGSSATPLGTGPP
ncbi:PREDICTED: Fc receptor-like protein 4 [Sturnus vulgaris]|uniref:Fc receptor-like protein 4 n=1 Tax=Sturnus vulgaris TaxID=9172 RepID=UPI00071AAA97|nr:PREDICTED: Fc receptor-like protein 4 [Sturnus vulgaris]